MKAFHKVLMLKKKYAKMRQLKECMLRLIMSFLLLISVANAGELPQFLQSSLEESYRIFLDYSKRAPLEIVQSTMSEKDEELFFQLDQINGFSFMFAREDVNIYKQQIILLIANSFSLDQVRAIIALASAKEVERKDAKKYFQEALKYQKSFNLNTKAIKRL